MSDWINNNLNMLLSEAAPLLEQLGYHQDNPAVSRGNTSWLESKQRYATQHPKLLSGANTGYFQDAVQIPTSLLSQLAGANNENPYAPDSYKFQRLLRDVAQNGWRPTPISVAVNHKGQPYISEGNTRVAMAKALEAPYIPGKIYWLNGAEEVDGPFAPYKIAKDLMNAREQESMNKFVAKIPPEIASTKSYDDLVRAVRRFRR